MKKNIFTLTVMILLLLTLSSCARETKKIEKTQKKEQNVSEGISKFAISASEFDKKIMTYLMIEKEEVEKETLLSYKYDNQIQINALIHSNDIGTLIFTFDNTKKNKLEAYANFIQKVLKDSEIIDSFEVLDFIEGEYEDLILEKIEVSKLEDGFQTLVKILPK